MSSLATDLHQRFDWLVCDLDGTVLDNDASEIPHLFVEFLREWNDVGGRWGIATGRELGDVLPLFGGRYGVPRAAFVVSTDQIAYLLTTERPLGLRPWNDALRRRLRRYFARHRSAIDALARSIRADFGDIVYADPLSPFCIEARSVVELDAVEARWAEALGADAESAFTRGDIYGRATVTGANKGDAVRAALTRFEAAPERVITAGNELNDIPMFRAGFGAAVAPENALLAVQSMVRAVGGVVGHGHTAEGVLNALVSLRGTW